MTTTAVLEVAEKKYTVEEYFELEKNSEVNDENVLTAHEILYFIDTVFYV